MKGCQILVLRDSYLTVDWIIKLQLQQSYLIAIGTHARRLVTAILVIPTLAADKAPRAAPNLLFGSLNGVTYSPAGVTSAVLLPSKFSLGI